MSLMDAFRKKRQYATVPAARIPRTAIPDGMWQKCAGCKKIIYHDNVEKNLQCCPGCGYHFPLKAVERMYQICDEDSFVPFVDDFGEIDPLAFPGYLEKKQKIAEASGLDEAVLAGVGAIDGHKVVLAIMDSHFMMGSMGWAVGEKITLAIERAIKASLPVVIFCASGGARMQEGIVSLMQMAKVSGALAKLAEAGLLYVAVATHPTTGGVTASFAMLGDIILAEKGALIGFAGRRVIEQTINQKLPDEFQSAEFLLQHGFVDRIVERKEMRSVLAQILAMHTGSRGEVEEGRHSSINCAEYDSSTKKDVQEESDGYSDGSPGENHTEKDTISGDITNVAWEKVQLSRRTDRPTARIYMKALFPDLLEFKGDRAFANDPAIIGGIATFDGVPVTVIGQEKGQTMKQKIFRNFGSTNPEGFRKSLRLMRQAEKFGRPVICFVDTQGAFCGVEAEQRGQGQAIAENLKAMMSLKVPIISIILGEGGSGGALALAVANEVHILANAVYSILSPEGFSSILWKDSSRAQEAAQMMKMTAEDLKELEIVDGIIREGSEGAHLTPDEAIRAVAETLSGALKRWRGYSGEDIAEARWRRFRGK
ncbi:MAG: acetyl-CoA carboxylase, carboxyltransferase subunit beta [Peptococcaceae bacterium]|nr:acetyl-CoA carboxylase, carboxyltransferase subunit beta [Peptococcaceae bacterium]